MDAAADFAFAEPVTIADIRAYALEAPCPEPIRTSFGMMRARPAVLVRIEDREGAVGWGEVWCNFPDGGGRHRAHLIRHVVGPLARDVPFARPSDIFRHLTRRLRILAIQTGEPGPLAQCAAALDIALWDLAARRRELPLWRWLGGKVASVPAYASGINPTAPERTVERAMAQGFEAFKLKIGFGRERDLENLAAIRAVTGRARPLMADANQAWSLSEALEMVDALGSFGLGWLEEPLAADRPEADWRVLAERSPIPLAAGENMASEAAFARAAESGLFGVVQPDVAKWGGISGCLPVARTILGAGRRYCPHYLGGAVGLLASAHLLAAVGGDGLLEVDINDNPLRTELLPAIPNLRAGSFSLPETPGLGAEPDMAVVRSYDV